MRVSLDLCLDVLWEGWQDGRIVAGFGTLWVSSLGSRCVKLLVAHARALLSREGDSGL